MRQRGARWRPDRMGDGRGRRPSAIWLIQLANASEASRLVRRHEERLCRKAETALYYLPREHNYAERQSAGGKIAYNSSCPLRARLMGSRTAPGGSHDRPRNRPRRATPLSEAGRSALPSCTAQNKAHGTAWRPAMIDRCGGSFGLYLLPAPALLAAGAAGPRQPRRT